jgi:hypothetical protein
VSPAGRRLLRRDGGRFRSPIRGVDAPRRAAINAALQQLSVNNRSLAGADRP